LGAQAAGASASDIASLFGMGSQQQQQAQAMLDAQRRNLQQRQMAPLAQFQALQPFVSMAPAGQFQTVTDFMPKPSAMQQGLSTGLAAFGALGQLYGGKKS
jgi:multidrug efflux pump subunit AcrA (membrane-fusion protein)